MFYYKNGGTYVASHTEIPTADEISKEEYDRIKAILDSRPSAPEGYGYRLTLEMEWELYEISAEDDPELTEAEALEIILGGAV